MITKTQLSTQLQALCQHLEQTFITIPFERKEQLADLAVYIADKKKSFQPIRITVICTHNSRRSHIGQLWLQVAARYYDIENFHSFSGGTEATAFNINAVNSLKRAGFSLKEIEPGANPVYYFDCPEVPAVERSIFSKKYDSAPNPSEDFAAIMVCNEADQGCPFIPGAEARFSIPYDDPKAFDGTPQEQIKYDDRVLQIGREFLYALSLVQQYTDAEYPTKM